ncbi:MAG: nucleotide exchange factor GrpE [Armatimonadota bacterium]
MGRRQQAQDEELITAEGAAESEGEDSGEETAAASEAGGDALAAAQAEAADWKDRYLRSLADMDNVRRRARMEAEDARKFANEKVISDLLPVLDNFTRALDAASQTSDLEALRSGVELIHRQLSDALERHGLERIEALGQPFDPNLHEAIMQVEASDGQEPHQVVEELRPGYRLHERVVRPSLVKVTAG